MCLYCNTGDWQFRHDPPWLPLPWPPLVPRPIAPLPVPFTPWPYDRLAEWHDILRRIKEMEDALGCPCEPNKADYLGMIRERLDELEKKMPKGAR
jgi:hypothetical protein